MVDIATHPSMGAEWTAPAQGLKIACEKEGCNLRFRNQSEYQRHVRVHTGARPFQCPSCSKAFARKACLKRHQAVHLADKPFKCQWCPKAFTFKFSRTRHERLHTGPSAAARRTEPVPVYLPEPKYDDGAEGDSAYSGSSAASTPAYDSGIGTDAPYVPYGHVVYAVERAIVQPGTHPPPHPPVSLFSALATHCAAANSYGLAVGGPIYGQAATGVPRDDEDDEDDYDVEEADSLTADAVSHSYVYVAKPGEEEEDDDSGDEDDAPPFASRASSRQSSPQPVVRGSRHASPVPPPPPPVVRAAPSSADPTVRRRRRKSPPRPPCT